MDPSDTAWNDSTLSLRVGLALSELSVPALWQAYAKLGGGLPYLSIEHALTGSHVLHPIDHDLLARVLNHHPTLQETEGIVRYSPDFQPDTHRF